MKTAARKDANHKEIAKAFEDRGFVVLDISQLKNCCDIFVAKNQVTIAVEIKDGAKCPSQRKLTDGEIKFRDKWQGGGGIWKKIETVEDVQLLDNEYFGVLSDVQISFGLLNCQKCNSSEFIFDEALGSICRDCSEPEPERG